VERCTSFATLANTCLGLSQDRELRAQWQQAAALLMAQADVDIFSQQVELALMPSSTWGRCTLETRGALHPGGLFILTKAA
jgi:hypothetical protein